MSNVKSESQVIPKFLIEDLTNVARGASFHYLRHKSVRARNQDVGSLPTFNRV